MKKKIAMGAGAVALALAGGLAPTAEEVVINKAHETQVEATTPSQQAQKGQEGQKQNKVQCAQSKKGIVNYYEDGGLAPLVRDFGMTKKQYGIYLVMTNKWHRNVRINKKLCK